MRYPRHPAPRQQPDTLPGLECFIRFLGDGAQFAIVQLDGDLQPILPGGTLLDHAAGDAAGERHELAVDAVEIAVDRVQLLPELGTQPVEMVFTTGFAREERPGDV